MTTIQSYMSSVESLASLLDKNESKVILGWLGDPYIEICNNKEVVQVDLDELASQILNFSSSQRENLHKLIAEDYLACKVHDLYQLGDKEQENANIIAWIFIRTRSFFARVFACCRFLPSVRNRIDWINISYFSIPVKLARENPQFIERYKPERYDSLIGEPLYTREQIIQIYNSYI